MRDAAARLRDDDTRWRGRRPRPPALRCSTRDFRPHPSPRAAHALAHASQVACISPAPFACGALLLASETMRELPALWAGVLQAEEGDGEERFADPPRPMAAEAAAEAADGASAAEAAARARRRRLRAKRGVLAGESDSEEEAGAEAAGAAAAAAAAPAAPATGRTAAGGLLLSAGYDCLKREPQFAGAERAGWWELSCLAAHAHPSVAAMARSLLAGAHVVYDGDPLRDLSLAAFLDRWLAKKPKAQRAAEAGEAGGAARAMGRRPAAAEADGPWSDAFARLDEADVAPADVFFHRYFASRDAAAAAAKAGRREAAARKGRAPAEEDSADDDVDDEEVDARRAARRRAAAAAAATAADDDAAFGTDEDGDEEAVDAALEAAELDELGVGAEEAAVGAYEAGWAAAWGDGGESDGGSAGESEEAEEAEEEEERPSAFAAAEDYEEALLAGGLPATGEEEEEEEEEAAAPRRRVKRAAPSVTPRAAKRR